MEIFDRETTLWWDGSDWQGERMFLAASVVGQGTPSATWSYGFNPSAPSPQPYWWTLKTIDTSGNVVNSTSNFSLPVADETPPDVSVSSPVSWSTVAAPVLVEGSASDGVGVASVTVEVYDRETTEWWDGSDWQSERTSVAAALFEPGGMVTSWSLPFDPDAVSPQPYWVNVRAFDAAGNASGFANTNFTIGDATPPDVSVSSPVSWSTVAAPVLVEGSASDGVGVASVTVEVYDRETTEWWDGSDWQSERTSVAAALFEPGGMVTSWSLPFDPDAVSPQPYWVNVRAFDAAGNASGFANTNFTIGDATPPDVSVSSPVSWSTVAAPVLVEGSASDGVGVASVTVEVYDRETTEWWDGSDWQSERTSVAAALFEPGGMVTSWSLPFDPDAVSPQPYWVNVRAFDAAGNASGFANTNFTIGEPG